MKNPAIRPDAQSRGSALLVVLAFLLLLTTLTVAFLSRATFERQLSNASFSQGKVDLAGQGAVNAIISDLQAEIVAGSNGTGTPALASGYYYPTAPATMVPYTVGFAHATPPTLDGLENLVKISYPSAFYSGASYNTTTYPAPNRASSVASTASSLNNRSISPARWNKPLLLPPKTSSDFTPVASNFVAPDWIYVARDGSNPTSWDTAGSYEYLPGIPPTTAPATGTAGYDPVTQRYAYAIYDEGSTLDLNVAGSPFTGTTPAYSAMQPYKNALAYADLTQLPYLSATGQTVAGGTSTTLTTTQQQTLINAIVGWRNYASDNNTGSTPKFVSGTFPGPYTFPGIISGTSLTPFDQNVIFNPGGFLTTGGTGIYNSTSSTVVGGTAPQSGPNVQGLQNQTDNAFASRQQLLQFFLQSLGQNSTFNASVPLATLVNVLPYFGTFSRDLSQPSYAPDPSRPVVQALTSGGNDMAGQAYTAAGQNAINPAFLNLTATSTFTRNDGSKAVIGEPLVRKRFALNRLAWLTYRGPSADRTWPLSSTAVNATDPDHDLYLLINSYGLPASFLQQGTDANIAKYFGLAWLGTNANNLYNAAGVTSDSGTSIGINDGTQKWKYVHGNQVTGAGTATAASTTPGRINTLAQVAALSPGRDPDFFELLKTGVTVGAIAKPGTASGSLVTPAGYQNAKDSSVDAYIIQLGANIIAQSNVAQYCPRIIFDDGTWPVPKTSVIVPQEYRGVEDLPYLYRMRGTHIKITESSPTENTTNETQTSNPTGFSSSSTGTGEFLQVPEIFNPHNWNPNVTPASGISPLGNGTTTLPEFKLIALSGDPLDVDGGYPTFLGTTQTLSWSNNNNNYNGLGDQAGNPGEPPPFYINGEAITFNIPTTGTGFFRESTLLNKPDPGSHTFFGPPVGSNVAASGTVTVSSGTAFNNNQISSYYKGNCYVSNASAPSCIAPNSGTDNQLYLGFNFGVIPLWFPQPTTTSITTSTPMTMTTAATVGGNTNFTYQLQYQDPITSGKWDTYDEKFLPLSICGPGGGGYGMNSPLNTFLMGTQNTSNYSSGAAGTSGGGLNSWGYYDLIEMDNYLVVADPRTARFSASVFTSGQTAASLAPPPYQFSLAESRWVDLSQNALTSARPDYSAGWDVNDPPTSLGFYNNGNTGSGGGHVTGYAPFFAQNWPGANYTANTLLCIGSGNQGTGIPGAQYYADPDGVVRQGMAAYSNAPGSPASTSVPPGAYNGLPLQTSTQYASGTGAATPITNSSRPIVLNRPFRSVAELGYTFSGTPGKNIDFATPESGYAALLDLFCINDTNDLNGLVAGKVDLNTRQPAVLNAVLTGAYKDEYNSTTTGISSADASLMATSATYGLISRTTSSTSPYGPLRNISELAGKYVSSSSIAGTTPTAYDGSQSYSGFSGDLNSITTTDASSPNRNLVQRFHEASIRALANCGTTRVWNLMIDVIAQTGRFPSSASTLANFNVEGERRYWVHVAIDRYTGKVLDEQIEEVKE